MILASQSPRRKELLSFITKDFRVIPAVGEEHIAKGTPPDQAVLQLSQQKAEEIFSEHKGETIVAADTVVAIDGEILGKPRDEQNAAEMLRKLSGRVHSVCSREYALFSQTEAAKTLLRKRKLSSIRLRIRKSPITSRQATRWTKRARMVFRKKARRM